VNLYAYCGNDPVTAVDPGGLRRWKEYTGRTRTKLISRKTQFVVELASGERLYEVVEVYQTEHEWVLLDDSNVTRKHIAAHGLAIGGALVSLLSPAGLLICVAGGGVGIYACDTEPEVVGFGWDPVGAPVTHRTLYKSGSPTTPPRDGALPSRWYP